MLRRLGRPEPLRLRRYWPLVVPVVVLGFVAVVELVRVPSRAWPAIWLGQTWMKCPWLVLLLSFPILAGLVWSFRRLAPARLTAAGAAAGLVAGCWSATFYCLHCPEASALFVLTWYTLGIAMAAVVGSLIGPRFLRW